LLSFLKKRPDRPWSFVLGHWSLVWAICGSFLAAAEPTPDQIQFFEAKIRPILVENCQRCHGEKKQSGALRLDSAGAMLAGGESGPVITPGQPEKSRLIDAINYRELEMPPDARLKAEQVQLLTEWVKMGAPWPGGGADAALQPRKGSLVITDADREHWAFRPIGKSSPLAVQNSELRIQNAIDGFIREQLTEKNLQPSPEADKRTLIRRLSFDLTGLPPSFAEVTAFVDDERPDAYERLVDRFLASPRYGERWARHWLDVVRFAQSNGYERDGEKPLAWRYRDYCVKAFNEDKPYDQFLIEQLAGDELDSVTDDSLSATGFYRLGVWDDEPDDGKQAKADELDDIVSTTASAMLGLTLGCARCHDHKFDPISQEDYYSFTAFFQNIHLYGKVADVISGGQPIDKEGIFQKLPSGGGETLSVRERSTPPPATFVLVRGNARSPGKQVEPRFVEVLCSPKELTGGNTGNREKQTEGSKGSKENNTETNSLLPLLPSVHSASAAAASLLSPLPPVASFVSSRGRRLSLARWIASGENPLAARVIVNRLWQHHFGRGIVATPSDFGHTGIKPTHAELLDYLASELIDGGWELKRMQRRIVTSGTYRQSSAIADCKLQIADSNAGNPQSVDPDNTLLWRQNLRRLEAEAIRDAVLTASGELNQQMGGRGFFPALPQEVLAKQSRPGNGWDKSPADQQARRSVYIFVKRTLGVPLLESFDFPSPDIPIAQRSVTTIAPQALILLNSEFLNQQAEAMAARVKGNREQGTGDRGQDIVAVYRSALSRVPSQREAQIAAAFLDRWKDETDRALVELCKLVLNLNEFVYVD
jgi:uncharacterized protein DUF1549/uncharacterized protein DUF1553/cytochrome c